MKVVEWDKNENISKILIDILEIDPKFSFDKEKEDIIFYMVMKNYMVMQL